VEGIVPPFWNPKYATVYITDWPYTLETLGT